MGKARRRLRDTGEERTENPESRRSDPQGWRNGLMESGETQDTSCVSPRSIKPEVTWKI
jgi:hypothetical protein